MSRARPLLVGGITWYAMAVSALYVQAVGALSPSLTAEFGLSRLQLGSVSSVFFAVAAATSMLSGHLVDRFGARPMLLCLFATCAIGLVGLAASSGFVWVLLGAVVAGFGTAVGNPCTNRIISAAVARGRRGLIVGFKQAGVPAGGFIAGALLPPLAVAFGWRPAVVVGAAMTLLGIVTILALPASARPTRQRTSESSTVRAYVPEILSLAVYICLLGAGMSAVQAYIVLYGVEAAGLSPTHAGLGAATVGAAGMLTRVITGPIAERFRTPRLPLIVIALGSVLATTLLMLGSTSPVWYFVGAAGMGITALAGNVVAHLAVITHIPDHHAGTASGVVQLGFYVGYILFPLAFGAIIDSTQTYSIGWALVILMFLAAALVGVMTWRHTPQPLR